MKIKLPWSSQNSLNESHQRGFKDSKKLFLESSQLLKQRREEYGMSRNDLATTTRITPTVLEAIENGWISKLPEKAYLCSMLSILEIELNLERKSLDGILKLSREANKKNLLGTINPASLEIISSWQGSFIYLIVILTSILVLNNQQKYLTKMNSQTFGPIMSSNESIGSENISSKVSTPSWVYLILNKFTQKEEHAWLELNLNKQSKLLIRSGKDYHSEINNVQGTIKLRLLTPVELKIDPTPDKNDRIKWNGKEYMPLNNENGLYKLTITD